MRSGLRSRFLCVVFSAVLMAFGGTSAQVSMDDSMFPGVDEDLMLRDEPGAPDLRILVAAPRAAVIGRNGAVLLAARPGRELHAEAGEFIRFVSGVREAVWYRGAAAVASELVLAGGPVAGPFTPIGQESILLGGAAPKIGHGRVSVDASFAQPGEYAIEALVRAGVRRRQGGPMGEARAVVYRVRVFGPGVLGSISGFIGREDDSSPLPDYPVAAVDPVTGRIVEAAVTNRDGLYRIRRLPPGSYLVAVPSRRGFEAEMYDDATDPASASPVAVPPGEAVTGIDLLLSRP